MSYSSRPTSIHPGASGGNSLRQPSGHASSQQQSSALSTRIAAKKAELENLRQLRDLSGTLAMQMQALETKISTLKDGTEGLFGLCSDAQGLADHFSVFGQLWHASSPIGIMCSAPSVSRPVSSLPPRFALDLWMLTPPGSFQEKPVACRMLPIRMWMMCARSCPRHWCASPLNSTRRLANDQLRPIMVQ